MYYTLSRDGALHMHCGFMESNNGFVHRCYSFSLDNLLVSFMVFLDVDYGS